MHASQQERNVLLIEDNHEMRDMLTQVLLCEGYRVHAVNSSGKANEYLCSGQPYSLILLDPRMPCTNGWELLAEVKRNPASASTPVVVMSNNLGNKQKAVCLGATAFIPKPLDIDLLLDTLCLITASVTV
jgi:CheY-like chemotaxis protein